MVSQGHMTNKKPSRDPKWSPCSLYLQESPFEYLLLQQLIVDDLSDKGLSEHGRSISRKKKKRAYELGGVRSIGGI